MLYFECVVNGVLSLSLSLSLALSLPYSFSSLMSNYSSFFFFYLFAFHNLGAVVGQSIGFVGDELNKSSKCFKKKSWFVSTVPSLLPSKIFGLQCLYSLLLYLRNQWLTFKKKPMLPTKVFKPRRNYTVLMMDHVTCSPFH